MGSLSSSVQYDAPCPSGHEFFFRIEVCGEFRHSVELGVSGVGKGSCGSACARKISCPIAAPPAYARTRGRRPSAPISGRCCGINLRSCVANRSPVKRPPIAVHVPSARR